jgi:hypothetical protein
VVLHRGAGRSGVGQVGAASADAQPTKTGFRAPIQKSYNSPLTTWYHPDTELHRACIRSNT